MGSLARTDRMAAKARMEQMESAERSHGHPLEAIGVNDKLEVAEMVRRAATGGTEAMEGMEEKGGNVPSLRRNLFSTVSPGTAFIVT